MKAILVVDIPDDFKFEYKSCNFVIKSYADITLFDCKGNMWKRETEVKPMPQKKKVEVNEIKDIVRVECSIDDIYKDKYVADIRLATDKLIALGFNACIDEMA